MANPIPPSPTNGTFKTAAQCLSLKNNFINNSGLREYLNLPWSHAIGTSQNLSVFKINISHLSSSFRRESHDASHPMNIIS